MRLRHLASVDPSTLGFSRADAGARMTFLPLDRIWQDTRFDPSLTIEFDGDTKSYTAVKEGDILVPKVAPTFAHGRIACARDLVGDRALATSEVFIVRIEDRAGARFLQYRLQGADFVTEGVANWTGVAGLKRISSDFLRNVRISAAAWDARLAIADFLDAETARIDALGAARKRQVELLREREAAVRDRAIAEAGAPIRLARALRSILQGWSPECEARVPDRDEWGVLKAGATNHSVFREGESKALPSFLVPRADLEVAAGDVLMSRANTRELVGSAAFVDTCRPRLMLSDKHYRVVPEPSKLHPRYLALILQGAQARARIQAETVGSSASMQNISQDLVHDLRLPIPSLEIQDQIVSVCSQASAATHAATSAIDRQIALLRERRQALITAAVSGRVDVDG